ncbi:MAG: hypothetical protein J5546_10390 [Lachnospiraceae bacterium]|nr:hypothetical protein [Lachnospiraceae bacterium]
MEYKEIVETERLTMRRLLPEDYKAMAAWDMDERVYKYLLGCACKTPEEPLAWLPKRIQPQRLIYSCWFLQKKTGMR